MKDIQEDLIYKIGLHQVMWYQLIHSLNKTSQSVGLSVGKERLGLQTPVNMHPIHVFFFLATVLVCNAIGQDESIPQPKVHVRSDHFLTL